MSGNDIRIQFQTWLSTQEAGCKTLKTRNEYVQRINRICERLYSGRSEKNGLGYFIICIQYFLFMFYVRRIGIVPKK